jgi:hypothetical protein
MAEYPGLKSVLNVRGALSEMCLPLAVDGRVVGTLNLEAKVHNAFSLVGDLAGLLASQASAILAGTRRELVEYSLTLATHLWEEAHDLIGMIEGLQKQEHRVLPVDVRREFSSDLARIHDVINKGSQPSVPRTAVVGLSLAGIVRDVINDLDWLYADVDGSVEGVLAPRDYDVIYRTLHDVFENIRRFMLQTQQTRAQISAIRTEMGGKMFIDLIVSYQVEDLIQPELPAHLYAAPVRTALSLNERPHLGSFVTGVRLRALGGDIALTSRDRRHMAITISLPLAAG